MEAIVGYRLWRIFLIPTGESRPAPARRRLRPVPCGVHHVYEWGPPGEWAEARCSWTRNSQFPCPGCTFGLFPNAGGHTWGFYAFSSLEDAIRYAADLTIRSSVPFAHAEGWAATMIQGGDHGLIVPGVCELAGKVVVADRGYRATHARLVSLFGPREGEAWAFPIGYGRWISIPWPWGWPIDIVPDLDLRIRLYQNSRLSIGG